MSRRISSYALKFFEKENQKEMTRYTIKSNSLFSDEQNNLKNWQSMLHRYATECHQKSSDGVGQFATIVLTVIALILSSSVPLFVCRQSSGNDDQMSR